jgi:hypothetical protein
MKLYENFFGYTFPETELFGVYTKMAAEMLWKTSIENSYKSVQKFLELASKYSPARLEKACKRACFYGKATRENVMMILERGLDRLSIHPSSDIQGQFRIEF